MYDPGDTLRPLWDEIKHQRLIRIGEHNAVKSVIVRFLTGHANNGGILYKDFILNISWHKTATKKLAEEIENL